MNAIITLVLLLVRYVPKVESTRSTRMSSLWLCVNSSSCSPRV